MGRAATVMVIHSGDKSLYNDGCFSPRSSQSEPRLICRGFIPQQDCLANIWLLFRKLFGLLAIDVWSVGCVVLPKLNVYLVMRPCVGRAANIGFIFCRTNVMTGPQHCHQPANKPFTNFTNPASCLGSTSDTLKL